MHRIGGLIIGESHTDKSPKQFLVDNMHLFKSLGVTILYMEHLLTDPHQGLLDEYLQTPTDAPMPIELKLYLNLLDQEHDLSGSASFTAVVEAAKRHHIQIIAIDTEATYRLGISDSMKALFDYSSQQQRFRAMNMAMIEKYQTYDQGTNYIAFVGSAHVATYLQTPGISDLLGCPHIAIYDQNDVKKEHIE